MAVLAIAMNERGALKDSTLVTTVMSNLGLGRAMAEHGIRVEYTSVGDRYVLETLGLNGWSLGGEQSGHLIMSAHATTGDGILTGLHLAAEVARTGKPLSELAAVMTVYPQVLVNVRGVDRERLAGDAEIAAAVRAEEAALGDSGRVLLRPSGNRADGAGHGRGRAPGRRAGDRRPPRGPRRGAPGALAGCPGRSRCGIRSPGAQIRPELGEEPLERDLQHLGDRHDVPERGVRRRAGHRLALLELLEGVSTESGGVGDFLLSEAAFDASPLDPRAECRSERVPVAGRSSFRH